MFKTTTFYAFLVLSLLLSSCTPTRSEVLIPAIEEIPTPSTSEQVAVMVTQTSMPELEPTQMPSPTPTAAVEMPTPTAPSLAGLGIETFTHTDNVTGFAFDYPANWTITALDEEIIKQSFGYVVSVRSPMPPRGPKQQEGFPEGTAGVDVVISDPVDSLEAAVAQRKLQFNQDEMPPKVLSEEPWVLPNGMDAVLFMLDTRIGLVAEMVTVIHGRTILVVGMGELALFEPIAKSLRVVE